MKSLYTLCRCLRSLLLGSRFEHEMDEEVRFHLEKQIEDNIKAGMTPKDARYAALRAFGGVEQVKEECRDMRGTRFIEECWQDVRYGLRMLRRSPGFTVVALLTLALGIGANSGIFSVINAALLRPLPYPSPDRLVLIFERDVLAEGGGPNVASLANFLDWQAQSRSFVAMAAVRGNSFNLGGDGGAFLPEHIERPSCSWSLFPSLGVKPLLGRAFSSAEDQPGARQVAVISHGLWQRR